MASESNQTWTKEEKAAMKARARELKLTLDREAAEKDVLAKIAEMDEPDRGLAEKLHALVKKTAPELAASTWYGMPAYKRDGQTVVFFQSGLKFKTRYCTVGFQEAAKLDAGDLWPTAFALVKWTAAVEKELTSQIKKAVNGK